MISGINCLFNLSSFSRCLKCPTCAEAVGYSFTINLPLVLPFTLSIFLSYICFGKFTNSSNDTLSKLASILSAIFSSAISMVMYNTFLPSSKFADAI